MLWSRDLTVKDLWQALLSKAILPIWRLSWHRLLPGPLDFGAIKCACWWNSAPRDVIGWVDYVAHPTKACILVAGRRHMKQHQLLISKVGLRIAAGLVPSRTPELLRIHLLWIHWMTSECALASTIYLWQKEPELKLFVQNQTIFHAEHLPLGLRKPLYMFLMEQPSQAGPPQFHSIFPEDGPLPWGIMIL